MGRMLPQECEHGRIIDWGDFGSENGGDEEYCAECEDAEREEIGRRYRAIRSDIRRSAIENVLMVIGAQTILLATFFFLVWLFSKVF